MPVAIPVGARADESSFKQIADQAEAFFKASGMEVGKAFADELAGGMQAAEKTVQRSAKKMADDYDKLADATGKVRVEQEKLNRLTESGAGQDKLAQQTEKLLTAQRAEQRMLRQLVGDLKDYESAAEQAGRKSSSAFGTGFGSGFSRSHIGGYFADLKHEAQSSGSMAGVLAGRAMGAGITAGLAAATGGVAAAIGGIGYTLTKGFQRLEGIDQAEFKLKGLGHSGAEVTRIMADAESSVKGTAFALDEAVGAAASAVAAGVEPGKDLSSYLTTIGDAAAIANTSFDEMASIFNKVTTSNKAYTQELRQLADRGIPIFTWLQQAYRVSGEELDKMVADGAVNAETFRGVIAANIGGAAKEMGQSFSGAVDNLGAAIGRLGAAALGAPFESAADSITYLTGQLDDMTAWMKTNQGTVIDFWSGIGQVATDAAGVVTGSVFSIAQGLSWLVNAVGDAMGGISRGLEWVNRAMGRKDVADQLHQQSEGFFGWANGINAFKDSAYEGMVKLDDFGDSVQRWGENAKLANQFTAAMGKSTAEISGGDVVGKIPEGPGGPATNLAKLGFGLEKASDGKRKIIPHTDEATKILDAWRAMQSGETIGQRVVPDFVPSVGDGTGKKGKGRGGKAAEPPLYFDESQWSMDAVPVSAPEAIAGMGPGVKNSRIFDAETALINARTRVEEARIRLLELEHKGNVSQSALVSAKNNVLQAERAYQSAEMKAIEAHQEQLKSATKGMDQLGAALDQDFGISKGLPGLAENITKFLANLAFAPALGALQAVVVAGGGGGVSAASAIAGRGMGIPGLGGLGIGGVGAGGFLPMPTGQPRQYQAGMVPNNVQLLSVLERMFPGVKMSADTGRRDKYNEHGSGEALDIMVGANAALGRQINEFLLRNAKALGLQYTLWQQATWRPDGSVSAMDDRGSPTQNHMDHVHARVLPGPATGGGVQVGVPPVGAVGGGYGADPGLGLGIGVAPSAPSVIGGDGASLPLSAGVGGGGLGVPGMAGPPQGLTTRALTGGPPAPVGLAPSIGAGGAGAQGISGLPLDAAMMAADALNIFPGAGIAAQKSIQLINRAIGYGGQLAGIGVSGLLNTFLPRESPLADIGNSWIGRLAAGFAGARPAAQNMAGQSTLPNPDDARQRAQLAQQQGGNTTINNTINQNNYDRDADAKAREATAAVHAGIQYAMPGRR